MHSTLHSNRSSIVEDTIVSNVWQRENRVNARRVARGWTQAELAERAATLSNCWAEVWSTWQAFTFRPRMRRTPMARRLMSA